MMVVHGGAWAIPDDMVEAHLNGVRNAADAGWRVLERGGSALDAVEAAVVIMEDDETFDAGRGSFLNCDGRVQLDAFIMDGATLRGGGVGCVERIANPVRAARKILSDSPHLYFVAEGAERRDDVRLHRLLFLLPKRTNRDVFVGVEPTGDIEQDEDLHLQTFRLNRPVWR